MPDIIVYIYVCINVYCCTLISVISCRWFHPSRTRRLSTFHLAIEIVDLYKKRFATEHTAAAIRVLKGFAH